MGTASCGGRGSKGRAVSGDRPMGAAGCRPKHTGSGVIPNPPAPVPTAEQRAQPRVRGPLEPTYCSATLSGGRSSGLVIVFFYSLYGWCANRWGGWRGG